jgi:glycosyltransferase involved in cell wall biosynthesis
MLTRKFGRPDFIHSAIVYPVTFFTRMLSRKFRISYGIEEHWTGYLPSDPVKPSAFALWFSKKFVKKAAVILPDSTDLGENMQKLGLNGHYVTLNNVVDTLLFQPQPKPTPRKIYRLLHISTLHPIQKNFDGMLRALNLLNDVRNDFYLEVVSDGDYNGYRELAKKLDLNDNIRFHGAMKTADIATLAAQCDILLLFSRYENFPCVIPEAFAAGIPVISTRVGGIHEHVLPPLGRLVETEDEQAFAVTLDDMLHHLERYDPKELHKYAEVHFSYDAIGKKLLSIYQQYINK